MKWLFRPSLLVLLSVVLAAGAAAVVLWPRSQEIRAAPLRDDESEIVWLYSATNESSWERFVTAVSRSADRLRAQYPETSVRIDPESTFPRHTTAYPELSITVRRGSKRLVFRWYKLTSDQKTGQWVQALLGGGRRAPLAVIGGSSSEQAKEIALSLRDQVERQHLATAPLLLLTTATADRVQVGEVADYVPLNELHRQHTYRFCFTNRQMAEAVTKFVAARDELRPDPGPFYVAKWEDDAYSLDLTERFCEALERPAPGRGDPVQNPISETIDYSVGGFDQPNRWEAPAVKRLMEAKITRFPEQRRPLLVLAAPSSQPARRFLRGLARTAPIEARRFVVVTGDALSFNTVYRDRNDLWPIQDLPFDLVFFCHRNPVEDSAGFLHDGAHPAGFAAPTTGTEDLLLYMDIVEALVQAVHQGDTIPANGDELGERLRRARWQGGCVSFGDEGPDLFGADGNRQSGTGEHVVWLRPGVEERRVQPRATIEVHERQSGAGDDGSWRLLRALDVDYDDAGGDR